MEHWYRFKTKSEKIGSAVETFLVRNHFSYYLEEVDGFYWFTIRMNRENVMNFEQYLINNR